MVKLKFLVGKFLKLVRGNKTLFLILFIASVVRIIGVNPGYNQYHSDQGITYSAATSMIKNGNLDPLRYDYPGLVPLINYIFFQVFFIPVSWLKYYITHIPEIIDGIIHIPIAPLEVKRVFQIYILGEREIYAIFWSRYVTALFGIANILLIYLLSKKLFSKLGEQSKNIGLIAAFLLAFNYKHVINSHLGLPDIYNAFFLLLSLLLSVNLIEKPTRRNYLLAAISVGLSFSTKYQVFAMFPFVLAHLFISLEKNKINFKKLFNPTFILSLFLVPLVFVITNPYFFIHLTQALKAITDVSQKYGMGTNRLNMYPLWYMYHIDYGPVEILTIFLGIAIAFKKFFKVSLMLLSVIVPFGFIFLYYSGGGFYVRNFITITPFLLIYAAFFLWTIAAFLYKQNWLRKYFKSQVLVLVFMIFLIFVVWIPGNNAIISSYGYTKPWGYDVLRDWSDDNLPKSAVVAAHPFEVSKGAIKNKRTEFELSGSYSLAEHKENGATHALINLDWAGNSFYFWMNFGVADLDRYWNKPYDLMRNTYHGVASEELFRYQIFSVTKPWQSPDSAIILAKIPSWPDVKTTPLKSYAFDLDRQGWVTYGSRVGDSSYYSYSPESGHGKNGSLVSFAQGASNAGERITSPSIEVRGGYLYKISGYVKTDKKLLVSQRDGFLRIDFYQDNANLQKVGLISSVSSRVYDSTDWVKKEIIERAPDNAKFMTISFGVYQPTRTLAWVDDIDILESIDRVEDITLSKPYIKKEIDLDLLYPNSHGNL